MNLVKIKTWVRIKRRIIKGYALELYEYLEWPIRLLVNWVIFLSLPVWIGPVFMALILFKAWESKKNVERSVMTGRIWYWEQFRQW